MEMTPNVCAEDYDPPFPVVCFDETGKQILSDVRPAKEMRPGRVRRCDSEYRRRGTRNPFMFVEPMGGWRLLEVPKRRTAVDFAHQMKWPVEEAYPDAKKVRVVLDNLSAHSVDSLNRAYSPEEAMRIAARPELNHPLARGKRLNMAELEFSVFGRSCLRQRIPDESTLRQGVPALEQERSGARTKVNWRFTTKDARAELLRHYPAKN